MREGIIMLIAISLFACNSREVLPADVLPREQMENLILDLARADQYVSGFKTSDSLYDQKAETIHVYQEVFLLHHTTKEEFEKSLRYYKARPAILKVLFDTLNARQQRQQSDSYNRFNNRDSAQKKKTIFPRPSHVE